MSLSATFVPADATLDEIRLALAPLIADSAAFDGWSEMAVRGAAEQAGVDPEVAAYAFSGGAMAMIEVWIGHVDAQMAQTMSPGDLALLPVRERIRRLVLCRLDAVSAQVEALRRALAIMAMPGNAAAAIRLGWKSADLMWRLAGDRSTDYNYYTKRAILAALYASTLAVFINDASEGKAETRAFLDRRIDGVMRFEKAKARWLSPREDQFSLTRFLGRLRYPAR